MEQVYNFLRDNKGTKFLKSEIFQIIREPLLKSNKKLLEVFNITIVSLACFALVREEKIMSEKQENKYYYYVPEEENEITN